MGVKFILGGGAMNKKIMSFVLAMVLSVGLGSSLFAATPKGTSNHILIRATVKRSVHFIPVKPEPLV